MQTLRLICLLFLLALLSAISALSQAVNATLVGTITDSSGAAVPKAQVLITETNTGINKTGTANESGNYTFPDLPPGTYSVTAEHPGFKKETRRGVEVLGRNVFSGPGLFSLNVSIIRRIRIRERYELQLSADSLNVTNTPQFNNPQTNMTNNNFGYVTSTLSSGTGVNGTGGGRVVTGGIKLTF